MGYGKRARERFRSSQNRWLVTNLNANFVNNKTLVNGAFSPITGVFLMRKTKEKNVKDKAEISNNGVRSKLNEINTENWVLLFCM